MSKHRAFFSAAIDAPLRAFQLAFFCAACLCGNAALAEFDLDRLVFDAFPLPPPGSNAPPPRAPQRFGKLPLPIAARVEKQLILPTEANAPALAQETVDAYLDAIARTQQEASPFDQLLFEPYLALGLGYQQLGDHEQAIAAFEKAEYISRINNGLFAPEQFPIIERMITSYAARGDLGAADQRRRYLYYLASQQYGEESVEVVPSLVSLADWNMGNFDRALKAGNNVGLVSGGGGAAFGLTSSGPYQIPRVQSTRLLTPRALAMGNLYAAQSQYYQAIRNMVEPRRLTLSQLEELTDLELRLIEAVFLGAHRAGILEDPVFYLNRRVTSTGSRLRREQLALSPVSFRNGQAAYQRLQIYHDAHPRLDPIEKVLPTVGLADWNMLFDRRSTAFNLYEAAAQRLRDAGVPEERIEALFDPAVPVQLPEIAPRPNSRRQFGIPEDAPLDYDGWVDVKIRISRYGSMNKMEVLDRSENVTREVERRLRRVLRASPFRPSLSAALAREAQEFSVRYYFKELPEAG